MKDKELFDKKISILNQLSSAIVATDNIRAIANLILDLAINYTGAEKGSLMLVNDRDELYILAARGMDVQSVENYRVKVGEGIVGNVAADRVSVFVEDIEKDERFRGKTRDRYKTSSFISCPIVSRNGLLGALNINDKADNSPFKEDEFTLIKLLANQAATVLEDAFLMKQLRVKASELEEINRKLIEGDIIKTEFLTRISHELRTPLNSVKGAIYYLQNSDLKTGGEQSNFHSIISNETDNLIALVENLLDFLILENEVRVTRKNVIDLVDILEEDILNSRLLKTTLTKKNIHLSVRPARDIPEVVGDKIRTVQFFINLIEGITQYLESGDAIEISFEEGEFVKISLAATRKLPERVIPFLFKPEQFFQGDQSKDKLKLYLASKTAEAHRWKLKADNTGEGFLIEISVSKSEREKIDTILGMTMDKFMEFISGLLDVNTCSIMLDNELTGVLTIKSARGLDEEIVNRTRIRFGDSIAGWVAIEGKPLLIKDLDTDPRFRSKYASRYNTNSLLSLPLKIKGKVIGVINLNNKNSASPFNDRDLALATILGERIAYFIESLHSGGYFDEELKQFLSAFDSLLSAEKSYFKKYRKKSDIFTDLILKVMDSFGAGEDEKKSALYTAMIYDLGLMVVDERILDKKSLTPSEKSTLKAHPYNTIGLLHNFEYSETIKQAILHHHERFDGAGYPDRLKGGEIPFMSRVISVVDAYCAMVTERPYKRTCDRQEALEEIRRDSGAVYDPAIVGALENVLTLH